MCVVTIYQYWEDHYRGKLAKAKGLKDKNCIFSEIFGDIASLRRAIIQNRGIADRKTPQGLGETWFQKGDEVFIDRHKFETLIDGIKIFIEEFKSNPHKFIRLLPEE